MIEQKIDTDEKGMPLRAGWYSVSGKPIEVQVYERGGELYCFKETGLGEGEGRPVAESDLRFITRVR